jgi:hypothetical protein
MSRLRERPVPKATPNRMILGDSLQVMASLADREALRGQLQMVYRSAIRDQVRFQLAGLHSLPEHPQGRRGRRAAAPGVCHDGLVCGEEGPGLGLLPHVASLG